MPGWFAAAAPYLMAGAQTGANIGAGLFGQKRSYKYSRRLAAFQHEQNMELLKYQLDYNSPASQMGRFKEAGLNPNLVYGQGSPGNMESAPKYPDIQPPDFSFMATVGSQFAQARLANAQADLTNQRTVESGVKQDLMRAQKDLVKANPYMKEEYVSLMIQTLNSTAVIKQQEAQVLNFYESGHQFSVGQRKILAELDLLTQRFRLGEADQKIKAQVLESKEFQNMLSEIQVKWMRDSEITPQHVYMFIQMLLARLVGR